MLNSDKSNTQTMFFKLYHVISRPQTWITLQPDESSVLYTYSKLLLFATSADAQIQQLPYNFYNFILGK